MSIEINDTLTFERGVFERWDFAKFALLRLLGEGDEGPYTGAELLVIEQNDEREVEVLLGETFPVAGQVWRLDSVSEEGRGSVTIRRVA